MAEEHRKRRSKAEVAAAREQYLKEREVKQQARAERKAERERVQAERQARKEQREKLKTMTSGERAQIQYQEKLEKARKRNRQDVHPINQIKPYNGDLEIGKWYTIRFAGSLIYGQFIEEITAGKDEESGIYRKYGVCMFQSKMPNKTGGFWKYPVAQENVLCEGVLTAEKCENLMHPTFNGISYY